MGAHHSDPGALLDVRCPDAIGLPPAQAEKLRAEANRLGLAPEDLARAAVTDLLSTPDAEFQDVARRVVTKNKELYKRLA